MQFLLNDKMYLEMKRVGKKAAEAEMMIGSFATNFNELFERRRVSKGDIAAMSNISDKTLWKLRNDEKYMPSLQTIVAVCVGMKLSFSESMVLIDLSPYRLRPTIYQDAVYTHILYKDKRMSVDEINIYLEALKCKKLGNALK